MRKQKFNWLCKDHWASKWLNQNSSPSCLTHSLLILNWQLLDSCLENPMDGGAWWAAIHGLAKSQTRLSDFTFTFMHWRRKWQPTLAWRIPGMGEPGGLPSLGSHRVGHDWSDLAAAAAAPLMDRIVWRALAQQAANNKHSTDKQRNEKMTRRLLHWKRQAVC